MDLKKIARYLAGICYMYFYAFWPQKHNGWVVLILRSEFNHLEPKNKIYQHIEFLMVLERMKYGLVMHRSCSDVLKNSERSDIFWSTSEHDRIGKLILRICRSSEHYFFIHYLPKTRIYRRLFIKYIVSSWCSAS